MKLNPLHAGNDFNEQSCCLFAPFLASAAHLTDVELDKEPFSCIRSGHWQASGLPLLPDEIAHLDWLEVFAHLRKTSKVAARVHVADFHFKPF
jgi:hypothetical protein